MNEPRQSLRAQHALLRRGELIKILDAVEAGESVRDKDLRGLLKDRYQHYRDMLESNQALKDFAKDKPAEISEYEALLSTADRLYGQMDSLSGRGHHKSAKRIAGKADTAYQKAFERLGELLEADPGLQMWLDRPVCFDVKSGGISLDPESAPRCFTSKSRHNTGSVPALGIRDKSEIIVEAVERAIEDIDEFLNPKITESDKSDNSDSISPDERMARILSVKYSRSA